MSDHLEVMKSTIKIVRAVNRSKGSHNARHVWMDFYTKMRLVLKAAYQNARITLRSL